MSPRLAPLVFGPLLLLPRAARPQDADLPECARRIHEAAILVDGHNDPPWGLRRRGDWSFTGIDLARRRDGGQTDIPRLRAGGVKAQFWSASVPGEHADPAKTVLGQIGVVYRLVERDPEAFELARCADDIERIAGAGRIASRIGIAGGLAIESDLTLLRTYVRLGVRYLTPTHNVGELLRQGDSERGIAEILRNNVIRAFRRAGDVASQLGTSTPPEADPPGLKSRDGFAGSHGR